MRKVFMDILFHKFSKLFNIANLVHLVNLVHLLVSILANIIADYIA